MQDNKKEKLFQDEDNTKKGSIASNEPSPVKGCDGRIQEIKNKNNDVEFTDIQGTKHELNKISSETPTAIDSSPPVFCNDISKLIPWFQQRNLLKSEMKCDVCFQLMTWNSNSKHHSDGYEWNCRNTKCEICKSNAIRRISIRTGSIFYKSRISLPQWLDIMYLWSNNVRVGEACKQVNVSDKTISNCYNLFIEVCETYFRTNPIKLGGSSIPLDIDTFCLLEGSRKRNTSAVWVFCIVDNKSSPPIGYMEIIEEYEAANLLPIILKVVKPGSIIHTEYWKEYCHIQSNVERNKSFHFVEVDEKHHKDIIESYGKRHKRVIAGKSAGNRKMLNSFLQEFMWRERFSQNTLESLCEQIAVQYSDRNISSSCNNYFSNAAIEQQKQEFHREEVNYTDDQEPEQVFENNSSDLPLDTDPSLPIFCNDPSKVIPWLQRKNLLKSNVRCEICCQLMNWTESPKIKSSDGYEWRCQTKNCKKKTSPRDESIFFKSSLSISNWLDIMYLWSNNVQIFEACKQVNVSDKSISNCYNLFIEVCEAYFRTNPIKLGGSSMPLDIDTFCLLEGSRKTKTSAVWVICMVDRRTSPPIGYMEIVEELDVATIFPIIMKVVKPGSIVHTKYWKEYCHIQSYTDGNESIHFVEVNDRPQKEIIETYGKKAKNVVSNRIRGGNRKRLNSYLQEFMWRERFSQNALESLCEQIVIQFPFSSEKLSHKEHQVINTEAGNYTDDQGSNKVIENSIDNVYCNGELSHNYQEISTEAVNFASCSNIAIEDDADYSEIPEAGNLTSCSKVVREEDRDHIEGPPFKRSCFGLGQKIQNVKNDVGGIDHGLENISDCLEVEIEEGTNYFEGQSTKNICHKTGQVIQNRNSNVESTDDNETNNEHLTHKAAESLCDQFRAKSSDNINDSFIKKEIRLRKQIGNDIECTDDHRSEQEFIWENTYDEKSFDINSSLPIFCNDNAKVVPWFQERNLLKSEIKCENCFQLMTLNKTSGRYADGYEWICKNAKCEIYRKLLSIRTGSIFFKSSLLLPQWLDIMYLWSNHVGVRETNKQVNVSERTIQKCFSFFREVCATYFKSNPIKLGGSKIGLYVDVVCILERTPTVWVLCIVDNNCSPSIGYLEIVEKMDVTNLYPLILKVVEPGSIIHTKHWKEYQEIQASQDCGNIVTEAIHFVDVDVNLHKEVIEIYCNAYKSVLKLYNGVKRSIVNPVIQENLWRERFFDNPLESLCQHIAQQFSDIKYNYPHGETLPHNKFNRSILSRFISEMPTC